MTNNTSLSPQRVVDYSRDSPTVTELPRLPRVASRRTSNQSFGNTSQISLSPRKPLAGLFDGTSTPVANNPPSDATLQKVAFAKQFMEERYIDTKKEHRLKESHTVSQRLSGLQLNLFCSSSYAI